MSNARVRLKSQLLTPGMILLALVLYVLPAQAFFRHLCKGELGNGRVDPIMSPGHPSQHLHVMFGASNFGLDPTIDELLASNCTSCSIVQDHSVYWAPRMYFQHSNGTLEMVPTAGGLTAYYFTESAGNQTRVAFPQNFRMIAGTSNKRAFYGPVPDPPMAEWHDGDRTQQALSEKAIGFNCLHYAQGENEGARAFHYLRNKTFIDATCTDGIRAELLFPSCWNGKDLDSDNHTSHVAYPSLGQDGNCPDNYPVRIPALFYETIYQTNLFKDIEGDFVFSNGDPTGYGYHGDFVCGWEEGVLQSAIDNYACTNPASTGQQEACPVFNLQDEAAATQCKMEIPEAIQQEQVNLMSELPGNVKIQAGSESTTVLAAASSFASSSATAVPTADGVTSASPADLTLGHTASKSPPEANVTSATTVPSTTNEQITITSTYVSNGTKVNMILVEELVTVTVSAPTIDHRKRHMHKHGHRDGRGRL